jgi:hypothetical protein
LAPDTGSFIDTETNGSWQPAVLFPGSGHGYNAANASCTAVGNCAIILQTPKSELTTEEVHGRVSGQRAVLPGLGPLDNYSGFGVPPVISCAATGYCAAGSEDDSDGPTGYQPFVSVKTAAGWQRVQKIRGLPTLKNGNGATLSLMSCTATGYCTAAGSYATDLLSDTQAFAVGEATTSMTTLLPGKPSISYGKEAAERLTVTVTSRWGTPTGSVNGQGRQRNRLHRHPEVREGHVLPQGKAAEGRRLPTAGLLLRQHRLHPGILCRADHEGNQVAAVGNRSPLPRTPGSVAVHQIDHEVSGWTGVVGETSLDDAGDRERQNGGIRRQRPVAAGSMGRSAALERGDRAAVVRPPWELDVRGVGDINQETEKVPLALGGGDTGHEFIFQRERWIPAGFLEFRHQSRVRGFVTVPPTFGRGAEGSAQTAGNEVMAGNELPAVDVEDQDHRPVVEHCPAGRHQVLHGAILPARSGRVPHVKSELDRFTVMPVGSCELA